MDNTVTHTKASHVEFDVRRPNGEIETINITADMAAKMPCWIRR